MPKKQGTSDQLIQNDTTEQEVQLSTRQLQALKTQKAIYAAAIDLINAQGYEKTTIDDIVRKAGTATGTFYLYFKTKRDLLFKSILEYDHFVEISYGYAKEKTTFREQLQTFYFHEYSQIQGMGKEVLRALFWNSLQKGDPIINNPSRIIYIYIYKMVVFGLETGELSDERPIEYYTQQIIASILGIDYYWCTFSLDVNVLELAVSHAEVLLNGICEK
ncbi:TetR/AcrR family transcriptional regulator [Chakrabartyella piscis]|uniref:TetR/AcrR family transcriptional regulator n=1 Tax=Chakrabartyella piscis TaxID=2918914 RepID=UPI002958C5C6|nr:TetR/AcrR family transcriptional regulator [Chakrabartyella piscis]